MAKKKKKNIKKNNQNIKNQSNKKAAEKTKKTVNAAKPYKMSKAAGLNKFMKHIMKSRTRKAEKKDAEKQRKTVLQDEKKLQNRQRKIKQDITSETAKSTKINKKRIAIISVSVFLVFGILAAALYFAVYNDIEIPDAAKPIYMGVKEDENSSYDLTIDFNEQKSRVKAFKAKGDKSLFGTFANDQLTFEEWNRDGALTFASIESNEYDLLATIVLEDGTVIYRSKGLSPGRYVSTIRLFHEIDYGTYECKLWISAFDSKTYEFAGAQYKNIKLVVGNEYTPETKTTEQSTD